MLHELFDKFYQQLLLVFFSVSVAVILGVMLGCLLILNRRVATICHSLIQAVWTIPSLALLTLMIPLVGIGNKPAVIALTLYAILPILQNTLLGLENADPALDEAARSFCLNRWRRLTWIELPQALPLIIGGIRIATVMAVGMATLAAFIGAGGLGDFINQGLAMNNMHLVILGAGSSAILALGLDFSVKQLQSWLALDKPRFKLNLMIAATLFVFLMGWCATQIINVCTKSIIKIGTKNTTEQLILGEMIADVLTANTKFHVEKKFAFGTTEFLHQAMLHHSIDLYPEYTGTAYLNVVKKEDKLTANELYQRVKQFYEQNFELTWLPPFGFNNSQVLVTRGDIAANYHLATLSQLSQWPRRFTIGASAEFSHRSDSMPGLKKAYGLEFSNIKEMELTLLCKALSHHEVDFIMAATTDSCIINPAFKAMNDDKRFFPIYQAAIVIRENLLQEHPEIKIALEKLSGSIDDQTMRALNYKVEVQHESPARVAKEFLKSKHII